MTLLTLLRRTDVVTKSLSGAEPTYRMSLRKFFFKYSRKNIFRPRASKTLNPPPCGILGLCETGFWANIGFFFFFFFFPMVTHRIFRKFRRYFPDPLSIRESFCEIAAPRKRVKYTDRVPRLKSLTSIIIAIRKSCQW